MWGDSKHKAAIIDDISNVFGRTGSQSRRIFLVIRVQVRMAIVHRCACGIRSSTLQMRLDLPYRRVLRFSARLQILCHMNRDFYMNSIQI